MGESEGSALVERAREALAGRLPGIIVWQEREPKQTRLIFPAETGSDYRIVALVRHDGTRVDVLAELVADPELRFWRHPLRAADGEGVESLAARLGDVLAPLLSRPTRIRQSRGLLTWRFTCELPGEEGLFPLRGRRRPRLLGKVPRAPQGERLHHGLGGKWRGG